MTNALQLSQKELIIERLQTEGYALIDLQSLTLHEHLLHLAKQRVFYQLCQANPAIAEEDFTLST